MKKNKFTYKEEAIALHKKLAGKFEVVSKSKVTEKNLSLLYTPGVAEPCKLIHKDPKLSYAYTSRKNLIAVVSDGSAVLGLGNIGALAAMPVMEGKCILFKEFAGLDAFPICLNTQKVDEIVNIVCNLEPSFGGINLEDISSPRCFEIEKKLKAKMNIPIFHDDQHGTAVVVLAGIINALKLKGLKKEDVNIVINGAGAAGIAVCKFLISYGFKNIIICDKEGILSKNRFNNGNKAKNEIARLTNKKNISGSLIDALNGADIFIGLSAPNVLKPNMVKVMNSDPIIFALSNPVPEIMPDVASLCGVKYMATGRSDFPNQVNNVLAFPGIMKGALNIGATDITEEMKLAAAIAIANTIPRNKLSSNYFIPKAFDQNVSKKVIKAVENAWGK